MGLKRVDVWSSQPTDWRNIDWQVIKKNLWVSTVSSYGICVRGEVEINDLGILKLYEL